MHQCQHCQEDYVPFIPLMRKRYRTGMHKRALMTNLKIDNSELQDIFAYLIFLPPPPEDANLSIT